MNTAQFGYEKGLRRFFKLPHMEAHYEFHTASSMDFYAVYEFSTAASIAFRLEKATAVLNRPNVLDVLGWIDVHIVPKDYGQKAYLRTVLPDDYSRSDFQNIITTVFEVLEIPQDVIYAAHFHAPITQSFLTSGGTDASRCI